MKRLLLTVVVLIAAVFSIKAQMPEMPQFPMDPAVRYGKLDNGLTYYIRHNELPEHQADFYIAQRVGSILEEESQRGLAHFLEHMAFNGTKNFPGKGVLNYLEKNGVKFGTDVNAYTAMDETVYNICNVPTTAEHPHIVDSVLLILHDWSGCLALEGEEIDNERGVIHEEWRSRNSAQMRMLENDIYPGLLANTKYPERMPIGIMEVVDNFKYDEIRNYYKKWYRPDLQGIVIVGDVDVDYVEAQIKELWKDINTPADAAVREYTMIEDNEKTIAAPAHDKEFPQNILQFGFKKEAMPREMKNTQIGFITDLVQNVIANAFSTRITEAVMGGKTAVLGGGVGFTDYIAAKTKDAVMFSAAFKENEWKAALDDMVDMVNTMVTYGFSQAEIDRVKADILTSYENEFNERDKRKNAQLTQPMLNHFLEGESLLDIAIEYQLVQQMLEALPLDVYNQTVQQIVTPNNRFIFTMAQEKEGVAFPTAQELADALDAALAREAKPYEEAEVATSLMTTLPKKGKIVKMADTDFGFKVWTLSNGAKIVWKQTDFKKDQIIMDASSPVGYVNLDGLTYAEQTNMSTALNIGGFAEFSATDVMKVLAGKNASAGLSVSKNSVSVEGKSTPKDIRSMMEQMYLAMTQPRMDQEAYDSWFKRSLNSMKNAEGTPNKVMNDSLNLTLYAGQPEMAPTSVAEFEKIDYKNMFDKSASLFKNAADFTFFFIGNINEDSLKLMAEQYIAALPSTGKATKKYVHDYQMMTPGSRENRFDLPMAQPMTTVYNVFCLYDKPYNMKEQIALNLLSQIAQMTFTDTIREKEGGVYSPGAAAGYNYRGKMMQFLYMFVTGEDKLAHIEDVAYRECSNMAKEINPDYFQKARDYSVKAYQENIKENSYWLGLIQEKMLFDQDIFTGYEQTLQSVTIDDVKAVSNMILNSGNRIQFVCNGVEEK